MGMEYAAAYADVIEKETLAKFCSNELNSFYNSLANNEIDIEEYAQASDYGDLHEYPNEVRNALMNLREAFTKKTGLTLYLGFHNSSDEGDRYDEVKGAYWGVGGMYELTKAGKEMDKYVDRRMFVQYG